MRTKTLFLTLSSLFVSLCLWAQVPVAEFTSNAKTGCTPIIVDFQDLSTGNPTSWKWDFGNGATSTRQNPSTTYLTGGTYTVKLTVTNASGSNTITKTGLITVYDGPTVNFVSDKTTSCAPGRIQFTDKSTASPGTINTSWFWDFGDGTSSTEQNPLHVYKTTGKFTVLLKVTNNKGCTKVLPKPNLVTITTGVIPNFTNTLPAFCKAPANINFTNTTTGPGSLTYTWLYGDGTSNTSTVKNSSHFYTKNGTFPVTLIVSSSQGCIDTFTKSTAVTIGGITPNFTTEDTLCATKSISFKNASIPLPSSSRWEFSDGTISTIMNPVKTFAADGTFNVRLINQYSNCKDTISKTINVSAKPVIDFRSANTVNCKAPFTVSFQNQTKDAVVNSWSFGDGNSSANANPSNTYSSFGSFNVKLKVTNTAGCIDSLTKSSFIKVQKPVITFRNLPVRGCVPFEVSPVVDINTLDNVLTYEWDFGDGAKASGQFPKHTYTKQGTYLVKLTVTTSTGCTETYTLSNAVRVGTKPTADFLANIREACAEQTIQFVNNSSVPTDEYLWQFGDGGTSTLKAPSRMFTDTGSLNVILIAYNNGCGDTITKENFIKIKPPIAKFGFRPDCENRLQFTFSDSSINANTWEWNFGDGSPVVRGEKKPIHQFRKFGNYDVSLKVTNGICSYTTTTTVKIVDQTPDFTASSQEGCKNFRPTFYSSSPVTVSTYAWDFGNGTSSGSFRPTPVYTKAGEYEVTLTTTDMYGCKDTRSKTAFIRVLGPSPAFLSTTNQGCKGMTTSFQDNTKTDGTNAIVSWQWNFGDGKGQSIEANPSYKYDTTGNFHIKLKVQDAAGCKDSITINNFVRVTSIKAAWTAVKESCPKANITFTNTTPGSYTSTWSFGDNTTTSTLKSPTHAYTDTGLYTIKLKVRDAIGCEDSLIRENYLYIGLPAASFTANNFISYCTPFEAKLTNTSKFYSSSAWTFQTGTSTIKDPVVYYSQTGIDNIRLIVTSPGGCKDTATEKLEIRSAAEGLVTYGPLIACSPVTVNLQAFEPINARFTWDFGDGNIVDTSVNIMTHVYKDFGKFVPMVILEEQCVVPLKGKDTIQVSGVDARFAMDKTLFCDTGTVVFTDSSVFNNTVSAYRWDFGDGEFSAQKNPVHSYKKTGSYTVRLNVQTQAGCTDSTIFSQLKVVQSPRISVIGDTSVCIGEKVQFSGSFKLTDTSSVKWQWHFPNGSNSTLQDPEHQMFTTEGNYQVRTIVTNSSGCKDSVTLPLHVHTAPYINMPATLTSHTGATLSIPVSYSPGIVSYNWSPGEGLSCTDCPQPIATPKSSTKYTVIATDSNGCEITGNLNLAVLCQNSNVFLPNTFSPNGDGRNDIFYVRGKGIAQVKSFKIFNRWGELIFERREIPINIESKQYGWDGTKNGTRPHPDVYIYQVEVICDNGETIQTKGNIALIQ